MCVLGRWKNVILYGEIKVDPAKFKMRVTCSVFCIPIAGPNQNGKAILTR